MTALEVRASVSLASIFALRLLGLFLILPVFAVYAQSIPGGNDAMLVGLALGIYGLTQGLLQIPFGAASDRWGRKPVITAGLIVFALGSFIAALAPDIGWTIVGRAIQGAGAVSAAVTALIADSTREEHRTKAMALVGGSVALTFAGSLVLAPLLYPLIGVRGLFTLTGVLVVGAIGVLLWVVPAAPAVAQHTGGQQHATRRTLLDPQLLRLNAGIFILHAVLMAMFVVVPVLLVDRQGLALEQHWKIYLPVVMLSFVLMVKPLMVAERRAMIRSLFISAIVLVLVAQLGLLWASDTLGWIAALAAGVFHRLQYSRGLPAVAGLAYCASVGERSRAGHLQYVAGVGAFCRGCAGRRDRCSLGLFWGFRVCGNRDNSMVSDCAWHARSSGAAVA